MDFTSIVSVMCFFPFNLFYRDFPEKCIYIFELADLFFIDLGSCMFIHCCDFCFGFNYASAASVCIIFVII